MSAIRIARMLVSSLSMKKTQPLILTYDWTLCPYGPTRFGHRFHRYLGYPAGTMVSDLLAGGRIRNRLDKRAGDRSAMSSLCGGPALGPEMEEIKKLLKCSKKKFNKIENITAEIRKERETIQDVQRRIDNSMTRDENCVKTEAEIQNIEEMTQELNKLMEDLKKKVQNIREIQAEIQKNNDVIQVHLDVVNLRYSIKEVTKEFFYRVFPYRETPFKDFYEIVECAEGKTDFKMTDDELIRWREVSLEWYKRNITMQQLGKDIKMLKGLCNVDSMLNGNGKFIWINSTLRDVYAEWFVYKL